MAFLVDFLQVLTALSLVGTAAAGVMAVNNSGFGVKWGNDWKSNSGNIKIKELLYGVVVCALSLYGLVGLLKTKGWAPGLHAWKQLSVYLVITGVVSLGASKNTGILFGSLVAGFGFIMFLCAFIGNISTGRLTFSSFNVAQLCVKIVQFLGALAGLGGAAAAIMGMVDAGDIKLNWCEGSAKQCWQGNGSSDFSLYAFALAVLCLNLAVTAACLKIQNQLSQLYPFQTLGVFLCFVGWCTMALAGNTGVLFGSMLVGCGGLFLIFWLFAAQNSGYETF